MSPNFGKTAEYKRSCGQTQQFHCKCNYGWL